MPIGSMGAGINREAFDKGLSMGRMLSPLMPVQPIQARLILVWQATNIHGLWLKAI
jgi:hypothetical protein